MLQTRDDNDEYGEYTYLLEKWARYIKATNTQHLNLTTSHTTMCDDRGNNNNAPFFITPQHPWLAAPLYIQFAVDRFLRWIVVALCSKARTENELRASHSNKRNVNIRTYLWLWRRTVHCFNGNGKQKSVFTLWCDSCKHWKTCWMLINLCKLFHLISNTPKVIQDN